MRKQAGSQDCRCPAFGWRSSYCPGLARRIAGVFVHLAVPYSGRAQERQVGLELNVIAAVILGGTSLSGGKGSIWGTLLGVLIMGTLNNGMTLLQFSSPSQLVAQGVVLLLAVGLDQLRKGEDRDV